MAVQSLSAFGFVNQTTTTQGIGAFSITNETVALSYGTVAGSGTALAQSGSLAATAGAGDVVGTTGAKAETAGAGAALAIAGSLGAGTGSGVALALSGSLGASEGLADPLAEGLASPEEAVCAITAYGMVNRTGTNENIGYTGIQHGEAVEIAGAGPSGGGYVLGESDVEAVSELNDPTTNCAITAFGIVNKVSTNQNIGAYGVQHEAPPGELTELESRLVGTGGADCAALSGSIGAAVGAANVFLLRQVFRQAITAYGHVNLATTAQNIGAFGVIHEDVYVAPVVGACVGGATVLGVRGSTGVVAGLSIMDIRSPAGPVALFAVTSPEIGSSCLAQSGSIGAAVGTSDDTAIELDNDRFYSGSIARAVGGCIADVHILNGPEGEGRVEGGCIVLAEVLPYSEGAVVGLSSVLGESPATNVGNFNEVCGATVLAQSGSIGRVDGLSDGSFFVAIETDTNIGQAYGSSVCEAFQPPLGQAYGDASCVALSGSIGECFGDSVVDGVNFAQVGECIGEAVCEFRSLPGQGHEPGGVGRGHGKGHGKKKKRTQVEIDGEIFDVENAAEAEFLIERAMALAKETAEKTAREALAANKKAPAPKIKVTADLDREKAKKAQEELQALYKKKFDEARAQEDQDVQDAIAAVEEYERQVINDILESIT